MFTDPHTWAAYAALSCAAMSPKITEIEEDEPDSQSKGQEQKPTWLSRVLCLLLRRRAQKKQHT